jgi:hypothetical protein
MARWVDYFLPISVADPRPSPRITPQDVYQTARVLSALTAVIADRLVSLLSRCSYASCPKVHVIFRPCRFALLITLFSIARFR